MMVKKGKTISSVHFNLYEKLIKMYLTPILDPMGIMGPSPVPLVSRPCTRVLIGSDPKANRPRNTQTIFRPDGPLVSQPSIRAKIGLCPKASQPRNAKTILRLGARASLIPYAFLPRCFLSRSTTPPNETVNQLFMV